MHYVKKLTTIHKVKHHIKARAEAQAAKKTAKKSLHQVHADNLYKMAHPKSEKRQKNVRRALTHVVLPVALIVVTAGFAIGAEVAGNRPQTKAAPPVPANSVCREYRDSTGLAAQDSRIGITMDDQTEHPAIANFANAASLNYLYAMNGAGDIFSKADISNNRLYTVYHIAVMKACTVNPGPAMPPFTSRNTLVNQQYKDFFGRSATSSEYAYWAGTGKNANQIVNAFIDMDGAKRGQLVRLYKAYYLRWPDAGGYAYWVAKMQAGTGLTKVSDSFAAAQEFKTMYGNLSNAQFVTLVYKNVLGRDPEPDGYNYWLDQLNKKKVTRGGVMLKFSESAEYKNKYTLDAELQGVTLRMLRRPATAEELQQWKPNTDAYELGALIKGTSEYANRVVK